MADSSNLERGESSNQCDVFEENEKLSIDMLRNTPSNIRRLADEIEQCEGRRKYLAQTASSSDGFDVRWYFCKVPLAENELAASVPQTEIVGKSEYFRFGMRDSLAIEASFLQREEELLSTWWKEYAECSAGPGDRVGSKSKRVAQEYGPILEDYECEDERVGVPVKGGLYEVDLVKRHSFPVYWNGENRRVLRGHWFARKGGLDWLPIREDVSEQLEFAYRSQVWHRRTFQPSGLFAARVDLQGSTMGLHALFTGEDDTWEAWLNVDASGFSSVVNLAKKFIKLRRGYAPSQSPKPTEDELRQQKEEEMDDYCSQVPVRHLVFMVHGIGQRLEKSNLVDDVTTFRRITASMAEHHLTPYQRGQQRVLFIPCQWRKELKLSGETAVEKCTLDGVRGLRVTLSATVHDVLYYMSPIYCQDIINSVSNQLNCLYLKFLKRNPDYDGKVSLYGHSLGSVLSYDILCHQESLSSPFPMDWMYKEHTHNDNNSSPKASNSTQKFDAKSEASNISTTVIEDNAEESSKDSSIPSEPSDDLTENLPETMDCKPPSEQSSSSTASSSSSSSSSDAEDAVQPEDDDLKVVFQSEIDTKIKSLEEEVVLLRAKVKELESQSSAQENEVGTATVKSQPASESEKINTDKSCTPYISYTKMEFKVDTFFAVGSPLGVFLSLRNVRFGIGRGEEYWCEEDIIEEMPACRQMFNIFHPFDPVAYRLEPLVCKDHFKKRPVIIPYHRGGKRLHVGFHEFTEDLSLRSQAIKDHFHNAKLKVFTLCVSNKNEDADEASDRSEQEEERSYGSIMMERLTGSEVGRIDHMLQNKTFQHPYISALGAHTNYWRDSDTALFILKHLYRDIPEEDPELSNCELTGGSPTKHESTGVTQEAEEELPLTFSNKSFIRTLSQESKKRTKHRS